MYNGLAYKGHQVHVDLWGLVSNAMGTHVNTKYKHLVPSIKHFLTVPYHILVVCVYSN